MTAPKNTQKPQQLTVQNRWQWREWLNQNHTTANGILLTVKKKNSTEQGVSLDEAVEEAVAFGWIDSKLNPSDQATYRLLFTPRKAGSTWSKSNKERVKRLIQQSLMTPAGLEKVEAAKRDGSWNKLDAIEELQVPQDFQKALDADPSALKNYLAFSDSDKKQILWWIESAKLPETRQKRIRQAVDTAAQNKMPLD